MKEENYYELFLLELATGLHLVELMALQWYDLDMMTEELRINKQVNIVGSELVVNELKTKAGGPNHDLAASSQKSNGGV